MKNDAREVHELIERLGNLVRAEVRALCNECGVRPAQLEVLDYLGRANRYSDTPQAVAEFLGLTKGTVSQTIKVLEHKGLLRRRDDAGDRRRVHLVPSAKGRRLVERAVPAAALAAGLGQVDGRALGEALRGLLRALQEANGYQSFAPCRSCRFNERRAGQHYCGLTGESLTEHDVTLICREHRYP